MTHSSAASHESYPDMHHDTYSKTVFGFWVYLLTDFVLFGTFFAAYAVLRNGTYGGPSAKDLFHISFTLTQTLILLTSSLTSGLAGAYAFRKNKNGTIALFLITFLLGMVFMVMEFMEFSQLIHQGYSWKTSAFLSAYFTAIGTHGVHILFAMLWIIVLLVPLYREGFKPQSLQRLTCLRLFWQFLNVIWIFIFSFVYLLGVS